MTRAPLVSENAKSMRTTSRTEMLPLDGATGHRTLKGFASKSRTKSLRMMDVLPLPLLNWRVAQRRRRQHHGRVQCSR